MTPELWVRLATEGGAAAVLALVVWALIAEWLVAGRAHRRVLKERNAERVRVERWQELAAESKALLAAATGKAEERRNGDVPATKG